MQNTNLPATFNIPQIPANVAAMMLDNVKSAAASFGDGFNRISFGGRTFHLKSGGTDMEWPTRHIDFTLVASADNDHRVFYKEQYDPKATEVVPPTCWATNGETPDADVIEKQSDKCETCPQNVKGSGGGKTRACARRRRLIVMVDQDVEKKPYTMDISGSSIYAPRKTELGLHSWKDCMKQIHTMVEQNGNQINHSNFLLQMLFTNDDVPVVQFSFKDQTNPAAEPVRASSMENVQRCAELWQSGEAKRLANAPVARGDFEDGDGVGAQNNASVSTPQNMTAVMQQPQVGQVQQPQVGQVQQPQVGQVQQPQVGQVQQPQVGQVQQPQVGQVQQPQVGQVQQPQVGQVQQPQVGQVQQPQVGQVQQPQDSSAALTML